MKQLDYTEEEIQICLRYPARPMTFEERDQEAALIAAEQEE